MVKKVFVEVVARFDREGKVTPVSLIWKDGRSFEIDRVLDVRRAASRIAGGSGIRYTVRIMGEERHLFYDEPIWFIESTK